LVDQGTSPITLNAIITGLEFFFDVNGAAHGQHRALMDQKRLQQSSHS
jgi:hypothetical protein